MYLRGDAGRISASHHVNLLLAPRKLLEKLPPTYVIVHTYDPLHDEGKMFADALQEIGKLVGFDDLKGSSRHDLFPDSSNLCNDFSSIPNVAYLITLNIPSSNL